MAEKMRRRGAPTRRASGGCLGAFTPWGGGRPRVRAPAGPQACPRTIAVEFGKRGVRCNAVNPGATQTSMMGPDVIPESVDMKLVMRAQPLDESRPPEVVVAVIAMLASDDGAHINGEETRVDGGTLA